MLGLQKRRADAGAKAKFVTHVLTAPLMTKDQGLMTNERAARLLGGRASCPPKSGLESTTEHANHTKGRTAGS
jgi:hypothetical protein